MSNHPRDEIPAPVRPEIERRLFARDAFLFAGAATTAIAVAWLFRASLAPIPIQAEPVRVVEQIASSPVIVRFPGEFVIVTHTPIPTIEPTPTYVMLPTPRPAGICLTSTPRGEMCTQPEEPAPTSTPVLPCPVDPGDLCIAQGGAVRWVPTITPIPEGS